MFLLVSQAAIQKKNSEQLKISILQLTNQQLHRLNSLQAPNSQSVLLQQPKQRLCSPHDKLFLPQFLAISKFQYFQLTN
jgi:hypothetical protein